MVSAVGVGSSVTVGVSIGSGVGVSCGVGVARGVGVGSGVGCSKGGSVGLPTAMSVVLTGVAGRAKPTSSVPTMNAVTARKIAA